MVSTGYMKNFTRKIGGKMVLRRSAARRDADFQTDLRAGTCGRVHSAKDDHCNCYCWSVQHMIRYY
jgi:hypothetical protein